MNKKKYIIDNDSPFSCPKCGEQMRDYYKPQKKTIKGLGLLIKSVCKNCKYKEDYR